MLRWSCILAAVSTVFLGSTVFAADVDGAADRATQAEPAHAGVEKLGRAEAVNTAADAGDQQQAQRLVTIQFEVFDTQGDLQHAPAMTLMVGQQGELTIANDVDGRAARRFTCNAQILAVEGPFHHVQLYAQQTGPGAWAFAATTHLRTGEPNSYEFSTAAGRYRALTVTILGVDVVEMSDSAADEPANPTAAATPENDDRQAATPADAPATVEKS